MLAGAREAPREAVLFDDFSHPGVGELRAHGWIVRSERGWPGVGGARWGGVSVGGGLLRLRASTDGSGEGTTQAQVCHARKYREGTYAARVRFRDRPVAGPAGDRVVQTFYAISPYRRPLEPAFSELDFEYLPGGGWGVAGPMLYATTWETFSPEPNWIAVNTSSRRSGFLAGWHVLVARVAGGSVTYWVDGALLGTHGRDFYPESRMSINFNLWFLHDGLLPKGAVRRCAEDVDWVFHRAGAALSPAEVLAQVARLRRDGVAFRDTVPAGRPRLASPCAL